MTLADNTERLMEQMSLKTRAVTDQWILNDAFAEFDKSAPVTLTMVIRNNLVIKSLRIAAVAAIVIVIWSVYASLFNNKFSAPKQIYNDLIKTDNFCISMYHAGQEQAFEQVWASKSLEMTLFRTTEQNRELLTLWDISRKNKMTSIDSAQTEKITKEMLNELEESMFYVFSLARFRKFNDIPGNAKLTQIQLPDSETFELSWHRKNSEGNNQYFKWRIILEENTNILQRTELYAKSNPKDQYKLDSFSIISYPEQKEIITLIRRNFDIVISTPEYQPTGGI